MLAQATASRPAAIRVLVADAQALVRVGVRAVLEAAPEIAVVAEARNAAGALDAVGRYTVDVAVVDVRLPERLDGIRATAGVRALSPRTHVVALSAVDADEDVHAALRAGATGFLLKDSPPAQLVQAVRRAAAGEPSLAPRVTRRLIDDLLRRPPPTGRVPSRLRDLSTRELEVVRLVARGLSNAEIGGVLFLGEATVKSHVRRILGKLRLRDRAQIVVAAYESGLVQPGALGLPLVAAAPRRDAA